MEGKVHEVLQQVVSEPSSTLTMWEDVEQNGVVSPKQVVLQVRRVPKHSKENPDLRRGLVELCSRRGLLGVCLKSHIS